MAAAPPAQLPTVDISSFIQKNDSKARQDNANELVEACHMHGAVGIVGHGISLDRLRSAFDMSKKLFALPHEDKMKAPHPEGFVPHRGYSPPGKERTYIYSESDLDQKAGELSSASAQKAFDHKEHYDIGSESNQLHYNIWLPDPILPGFRKFEMVLFWELHQLSRKLLDAIMLGLGLQNEDAHRFRESVTGHDSVLRLLHYPAQDNSKVDRTAVTWQPGHTDFSAITLLFQHTQGGLEFEDRTNPGTFIMTPADMEERLFLNVGDPLEIFTNGYLPASKHRVELPHPIPGSQMTPDRYSIPYFVTTEWDHLIVPQTRGKPGMVPKGEYKSTTFGDYVAFRSKYQHGERPT